MRLTFRFCPGAVVAQCRRVRHHTDHDTDRTEIIEHALGQFGVASETIEVTYEHDVEQPRSGVPRHLQQTLTHLEAALGRISINSDHIPFMALREQATERDLINGCGVRLNADFLLIHQRSTGVDGDARAFRRRPAQDIPSPSSSVAKAIVGSEGQASTSAQPWRFATMRHWANCSSRESALTR